MGSALNPPIQADPLPAPLSPARGSPHSPSEQGRPEEKDFSAREHRLQDRDAAYDCGLGCPGRERLGISRLPASFPRVSWKTRIPGAP